MRTIRYFLAIGLIGMQVGCASNIVVKMPQITDKAQIELLADVKVMDLRQPGVASSKREAAFGVPMGTVEFDPPAAQLIKQELETELTKLLTEKGIRSKRYYVADLMEFGVNTDTTPLYWDVIGRIHLLVKEGENQHDLFGTHTIRTYVWPGEEIIQKVISESMKQIISGLKPVSAGGMDKPFADKSASTASKPTANRKVTQPRSFVGKASEWKISVIDGHCQASKQLEPSSPSQFAIGITQKGTYLTLQNVRWSLPSTPTNMMPVKVSFDSSVALRTEALLIGQIRAFQVFVWLTKMPDKVFWKQFLSARLMSVTGNFKPGRADVELKDTAEIVPLLKDCAQRYLSGAELPF